jgi:polar amino acid transport system substrate-binding protein
VKDLRDFARKPAERDKEPMSLNAAVENALRLAKTTIRKAGAHVEVDLEPGLPLMEGVMQNIEQVVLNLVINALESIDHDRGRLKIVTGFRQEEQKLFLSVVDNGRGIDPEVHDRIYDAFVTTKKEGGGLGLGLSITRRLVKAHEGEIGFQSEQENGTEFTVVFPCIDR